MSALVQVQRYNWMGYRGTETDEVNTKLLRGDGNEGADVKDYERRQQIIADVHERLYQIKKDLDLIPEEEVRAEEEQRERRRQARQAREDEARRQKEEAERQREADAQQRREDAAALAAADAERQHEEEARAAVEAEKRKEEEKKSQALAARWRAIHNSDDDSEAEEDRNELLDHYPRTQEEIDDAVGVFGQGCRSFLLGREDAGYTSYLDGTQHLTLTKLNFHNAKYHDGARMVFEANRDTNKEHEVEFPEEEEYHTEELAQLLEAREHARRKLDAYRCHKDETYIARLREEEKTADGAHPATALTDDELAADDETALRAQLEAAQQHERETRRSYNQQAAGTAAGLARVMYSKVAEGSAEGVVVPGDETMHERDFAPVPITTVAAAPVSAAAAAEEEEEDGQRTPPPPETVVASTRVKHDAVAEEAEVEAEAEADEYHEIGDPVKPPQEEEEAAAAAPAALAATPSVHSEHAAEPPAQVAAPVEEHSASLEAPHAEEEEKVKEEVEEEHVQLDDKDFEDEEQKKKKDEADEEFNKEL